MDGHGNVIGRIDVTKGPRVEHLKLYDGHSWTELDAFDATGDSGAAVAGLTEDGKFLIFFSHDSNSLGVLTKRALTGGNETNFFENPNYDVWGVLKDGWTGRVIGASYIGDKFNYVYFDPVNRSLQRGLELAFPGNTVHTVSADRAKDRVVVEVSGPRHPASFYFLDRTTHQASELLKSYPELTEADLGEMKPYPYSARDGLPIAAYLTLPPGKDAKNLPVVIMPHGGPDSRDYIQFDWWAQFLANRGYAVFQPNFRGSAGYGHKFTEAGLQQWGLKMQDDITDGVKKMIADGVADPKRICIVGASYGGYAALAGATFTPDLYACAMSFAGVSDLPEMLHSERGDHGEQSASVSFWASRIGNVFDDTDRMKATSPDRNAEKVKCPILLMHGEGDTTVHINQSEHEYDALKSAGKDVQFIRFAGEDHYLNFSDTRIRMLTELEAFLKKNIGN
jgi:dipeptidyl aminopeptidase/acylaminoacyl peptidase